MPQTTNFIAVDLGASNGRVLLGQWDGTRFELQELHRFPNGPVNILGRMHWDVLHLWNEIKIGLSRYAAQFSEPPAGIGVDTWGVDFGLFDSAGQLLGNPVHYRDSRTDGIMERLFARIPAQEVFAQTGIQFMQFNTLFQLFSMVESLDPQLNFASTFLMMPDLFHYWLTGRKGVEYTIASTSQMYDCHTGKWAYDLLEKLSIPTVILPEIVFPGSILGPLKDVVAAETGLPKQVPVIATGSHDTASAVAAVPGLDSESIYISSGTWSLMGVEIPRPLVNEQVRSFNVTNEGGVGQTIRFLKNIAGLWLLQECRNQWQREGKRFNWDELLREASCAPALRSFVDPDAAMFLCPPNMPEAIQQYCRNTRQPVPEGVGPMVRCCLESMALKYRVVLEALEKLTSQHCKVIRIVGGGSQNLLLSQLAANACQREVVTGPVEATALGNLMMQAIATGHLKDIPSGRIAVGASSQLKEFSPSGDSDWDKAFERFKEISQI
jgi:rhamnulokinase